MNTGPLVMPMTNILHRPMMAGREPGPRLSTADLKRVALFNGLTEPELEGLARDFTPRRFRQNETVFSQGDAGQVLYLIASGQVRIYLQDERGQETSVVLYGPGDLFGELAVIDGRPRSASAIATSDTQAYLLTRERFLEQIRRVPQLAFNILNTLSVRIRSATRQVGSLVLHDVPERLARKLVELAQAYGRREADGIVLDTPLTQSDLAGLVGATRESINKALGVFRRHGWITVRRGRIVLLDEAALREFGA